MKWLTVFFTCALISVLLGLVVIPFLRKLKYGQSILEIGPDWHMSKSGTPTMGGIIFIISFVIGVCVFAPQTDSVLIAICALLFGVTGFIDDYVKVVKKRNLGLTATQKFSFQLIISVAFVLYMLYSGRIDTSIIIPVTGRVFDLGYLFVPFAVFVMTGTVNSVNITDGLDGLAGFVTLVVVLFLSAAAATFEMSPVVFLLAALAGGISGFLVYNKYPAKVFMGDTGSLFLGGVLSATAILMRFELVIIFCGAIYVIETLSVILQVASFKLTGKRIFKMAPIHHHFEKCGLHETKIVFIFTLLTLILCVITYFGII